MSSLMQMPVLDWKRARNRVAEFNSSGAPYYLAEVALHEAFRHGLTPRTVPLCVMAVNSFWNANVDKEPGALKDVCERTVSDLDKIKRQLKRVRSVSLPVNPSGVSVIVSVARQLLPRLLKASRGKRTNYSFASKFLHWSCPSSFPIVDNLSTKTINHFVGRGTIWISDGSTASTTERCIQSYNNVIDFYNEALRQLDDGQRAALVRYDFETQPQGFRRQNTAVRILDKWLWMEQKHPQS